MYIEGSCRCYQRVVSNEAEIDADTLIALEDLRTEKYRRQDDMRVSMHVSHIKEYFASVFICDVCFRVANFPTAYILLITLNRS